ncbi:MAG: hypothetical protein AAF401_16130 [Pseudomonadota bacterium]
MTGPSALQLVDEALAEHRTDEAATERLNMLRTAVQVGNPSAIRYRVGLLRQEGSLLITPLLAYAKSLEA